MKLIKTTVKYVKIDQESGKEKNVTERYLFKAELLGEAEERTYNLMHELSVTEFNVTKSEEVHFSDIINIKEGEIWYKITISFDGFDQKTNNEKRLKSDILIMGDTTEEATENLKNHFEKDGFDYKIESISDSRIIEYLG